MEHQCVPIHHCKSSRIGTIMKLVALAALIAVCGAAKLDRTYLPPASAKTAGGSPGALQTPFAGNSFNNGLGGLPKGSYENDFQGVVVDAAAAGTRAAEEGVSGLGAPRISYGSTDSKVGAAAFKTNPSAYRPETNDGQTAGNFDQGSFGGNGGQGFSGPERPRAALDRAANVLRYENEITPEGYHYAFETDNGISSEEAGVATNGVQAQGGFSYTADDGNVYSVSYTADENGYQPRGDHLPTPPPIPEEILKSLEQNARDEAAGLVDDGSYNAEKYNAGNDYSENGDANGKFTHQSSNFGKPVADVAASGTFVNQNNQPFRKPSSQSTFGSQDTSSASQNEQIATGFDGQGHSGHESGNGEVGGDSDFSAQSNQNSASKPELSQKLGQSAFGSQGQTNAFGSSPSASASQGFGSGTVKGQNGQRRPSFNGFAAQGSGVSEHSSNGFSSGKYSQSASNNVKQDNRFGSFASAQSVSSSQGLGNRNEYLPPVNKPNQNGRPQSGRPQSYRPQTGKPQPSISSSGVSTEEMNTEISPDLVPLGQQDLQSESHPQSAVTSFGQPVTSNGIPSQNRFGVNNENKPTNGRRPSINGNSFSQGQSSQFNRPNEYLPPDNRRPFNPNQGSIEGTQYNQAGNGPASGSFQSQQRPSSASFGSQASSTSSFQQNNVFNRPQSQKPGQNANSFPATQPQSQFGSSAQSNLGFNSQKPTLEPDRELTTPLETSKTELSQPEAEPTSSGFISSSKPNGSPAKLTFNGQFNQNRFASQSNSQPSSRPGQTNVSAFPTQTSFGQFTQFENQRKPQNSFSQKNDAQYASSTQRPSYAQQPQGADDSYFYNQPSKPFNSPQGSRFPSAPSNQFDRITQSSFSQNNQFASPSGQFAGSSKYPRPPTVAPSSSSSQSQGQFSGQVQGSSKYPRPPTVAPTVPSAQTQFQGNAINGVTQATASQFPSQTPTQATQGQFGSRPSYQQSSQSSQFSQTGSSFSQKPTRPSFSQQSTAPQKPSNAFQSQSQAFAQQSLTDDTETEQPVSSQQYNGEIYEYNKPAQSLPPPDSTPASSSIGFGQKVQGQGQGQFTSQSGQFASQSGSQLSQTNDQDDQRPSSQFGGSIPQFGSQSQFGQTAQSSSDRNQETEEDSKPYGALAQSQNAAAAQGLNQQSGARPQFGAPSFRPQSQKPSSFGVQSQTSQKLEEQKPQFGVASSQNNEEPIPSHGSQNQFGFMSACCKDRPQKQGFGGQFSQAFTGVQNRPQPTSSFSGMGEEFGGPRQPPSFDEQTGYHY